uniref:chitinase n=1 Tax=Photinus pyralis TaxID=7054 RepID=A0A1Y1NCR6_PHOPY
MKSKNPNLKTLLAVGGWKEGSVNYSKMAGNTSLRSNFITSAINLMNKYGFDGFDIDWEYPAQRGGVPQDKANFVTLVREFRQALGNGRLLSIAAGATPSQIATSYNVSALIRDLDFINVMTYDLHGSWDGVTGANAPLFSSSGLSVSQCIDAWIANGAPSSKLVMGIPVYGRTFTLTNSQLNGIGAPTSQPGAPGPFTQEAGIIGYNEMCLKLLTNQWVVVWHDAQKIPYAYKENQWVSYDEQRSVGVKVQYIKQRDLGGAMIWSIDTDDFRGTCGTKYPILTTIKNGLI